MMVTLQVKSFYGVRRKDWDSSLQGALYTYTLKLD